MNTFSIPLITAIFACAAQAFGSDAAATPALDKTDLTFIEKASQAGMFEVRTSELAIKRGVGSEEQALARQMVDDHTKANTELTSIAAKKGVTVASDLDKKHQEKLDKLGAAADKDFAKDYVDCQVKAHKQAVDLFADESKDGKDADLRAFAAQTLPTLKAHLEHAKKIADAK